MEIDLSEIKKLANLLTEAGIPFTYSSLFDGKMISYPVDSTTFSDQCVCAAVINQYSIGHTKGLLEISGIENPATYIDKVLEIEGDLTADEVFSRIKKHYEENPDIEKNLKREPEEVGYEILYTYADGDVDTKRLADYNDAVGEAKRLVSEYGGYAEIRCLFEDGRYFSIVDFNRHIEKEGEDNVKES